MANVWLIYFWSPKRNRSGNIADNRLNYSETWTYQVEFDDTVGP